MTILAAVIVPCAIASMFGAAGPVIEALAPVVNSGSAIIAVAFIAGVIVYRRIRKRKDR